MLAISGQRKPERIRGDLYNALIAGDEVAPGDLLIGLYQKGSSVVELGDDLPGPVFRGLGEDWDRGDAAVREERRCCEIATTVLHELRRWIPDPPPAAPLALAATPGKALAEVPIRLVELVLKAHGWRTHMAGCGLPVSEIKEAIARHTPRLVCISAIHLEDTEEYIGLNTRLLDGSDQPVVVGGGAFTADQTVRLSCQQFASNFNALARWLEQHG
ncbi:MAG: cobalamin-dependent protein [Planctomycetota bacterium]